MAVSLRAPWRLGVLAAALAAGTVAVTEPEPGRAAAPCASHNSRAGTITICPATGPVGTLVTIRGDLTCGQTVGDPVPVAFLGPGDTGGGGAAVRTRIETSAFEGFFRIPLIYAGGPRGHGAALATAPGSSYAFATEPGGKCSIAFTVLAPAASHARLWRTPGVSGLTCGRPRRGTGLLCLSASPGVNQRHHVHAGDFAWALDAQGHSGTRTVHGWPLAAPAARVTTLPAGTHWSSGGLQCTAGARRVTCRNGSGHGFVVGQSSDRRF